jgi:hypothetical protein
MLKKMGFNKKGMAVMWYLIEAVLISIVIIFFFQYIQSVKDDTMFEKLFLSRDLALMTDTINSVPGDVKYTYQETDKLEKFYYQFTTNNEITNKIENKVSVYVKDEYKPMGYHYYINKDLNSHYEKLENPKKIVFGKTQLSTNINSKLVNVVPTDSCSRIETKNEINTMKIDYSDDINAYNFANYFSSSIRNVIVTQTRTKDPTVEDDRIRTINEELPLVLSFRIGSNTDLTSNPIKIYYSQNNKDKSEKLACLIYNNLDEKLSTIEIKRPIPSSNKLINTNKKGIGIMVEIGNDKITNNELFNSKDKIVNDIIKAIGEYNG